MLLFKLLVTPLLMGVATLVTRTWGPAVGGIFTALPLTAGPVSAFLYVEQGPLFALDAACASMLGYAALVFFILAFVRMARRGWGAACLCGALTYFSFAWLFSFVPREPSLCLVLSVLCLTLVLRLLPRVRGHWVTPRMAWWDLPGRMVLAGGLVLTITGLAHLLGPQWSGFLGTYPVFITLMGVFTLVQAGGEALGMLMRSFVAGLYGSVIFFYVLCLSLPQMHPALAYGLASLVNIAICAVDMWLSSHSLRALQRHLRARRHRRCLNTTDRSSLS